MNTMMSLWIVFKSLCEKKREKETICFAGENKNEMWWDTSFANVSERKFSSYWDENFFLSKLFLIHVFLLYFNFIEGKIFCFCHIFSFKLNSKEKKLFFQKSLLFFITTSIYLDYFHLTFVFLLWEKICSREICCHRYIESHL